MMQDDSRCRPIDFADGLRHGHEDDLNQQQPDSGVLAGPAQSNQPLTENNLDRHTRDHPPDARNTVAWYLRGLQTGTGTVTSAGVSFPAVQAQSTQHISSRSDRRKVVNTQDDIELYLGAEKAPCPNDVQGSHVIAGGAATLPAQATPPGLSNTKLVEARRLLVASIRSKHDPADQKKKTSLPASVASTHSSARQPLRAQALSKKSSNNAGNQIGEISAKEHVNRNDKNPRHTSRRKLSDPDPSAQRGLKPHSKSASQRVMPVQADSRTSHAGQKEKDDHRKLLDQRKERRRAKAIIVKDRSKITAPSETIVKANKKAHREAINSSEHRKLPGGAEHDEVEKDTERRKRSRQRSLSTSSISTDDKDNRAIHYQVASKKRSNDVQRSMAALKGASKGKGPGHKRKRWDPLERATNILPAGRITLKAKTGIYNHGQASAKQDTGQGRESKKLTDLAFSELPFLNQPIAKSSRRQPLEPPDSNAYRKQKVTPYDMRASVGEMRKEASSVCEETGSEQHFSRIMQDRPRSPKRINIESSTSPTKPKRTAPSSKKKSDFNVPPEQKDSHQASHRPQGLSLETRDLSSAASNRLSVQGTLQATTPASRVLSSLPGSGQQLSSLTGLSAGSLARRRLLRRMDRAAESLEPRPTRDELQRELHAFRALESQDQQGHGPSARYGSAKIPIKTPRPPPDLPQPGPSYFPSVLPDLCRSCSSAKMQHIHRSPDWFASNGSNADVAHNNAQIFSRDTASVKTPMYAGPGFDQYAQSANVIPDYGLPTGSSDYYSAFQNNRHVDVGLPDHAPQASTSYGHSVQAPAHQQAFDEQFAQHGCTLNENFPSTEYSWELVGRRPLQRSSPQMMSSAGHAHLQTCIPNASPVVPGSFPSSVPYMDEVAQFQRGREDLFSYFPHTSSPARLQPLSGFWQRNYL